MREETHERLKEIKRSFRSMMNGPVSQSMRDKGTAYKINWGVAFPALKRMADTYGKDYELAIGLWKEDIRECKILATLIMPPAEMLPEIVDIWMEQTPTQEMVEMAALNLYQYLDFAPVLAYRWMALDKVFEQIAAYQILGRLFMRKMEPNERGINEFLDQAVVALQSEHMGVRHAAYNCIIRFADMGEMYETIARKAVKSAGLADI